MTPVVGFITAAVQLGVESILVKPSRSLGSFVAQVILEETHTDEMEITEHPIEQGASIADHAFMRPAELMIKLGWSNSPTLGLVGSIASIPNETIQGVQSIITGNSPNQIKDIYQSLLVLQRSRIPFDVVTGKRVYTSMLIKTLSTSTDNKTENSLMVTALLKQVIMVTTRTLTVTAAKDKQRYPESTDKYLNNGVKQLSPAPNFNIGAGVGP